MSHGVHAEILKQEARGDSPREHFQTSSANDFASADETAQPTFSDQRPAKEPASFGQADRFTASEMEGSQNKPTLTDRLHGGIQQAAAVVTGSQDKNEPRQVPTGERF